MMVRGERVFLRRSRTPGREPDASDFRTNSLVVSLSDRIIYYAGGYCPADSLPEWLWEILSETPETEARS